MTAPDQPTPTEGPDAAAERIDNERFATLMQQAAAALMKRAASVSAGTTTYYLGQAGLVLLAEIERLTARAEQAERERDDWSRRWEEAAQLQEDLHADLVEALGIEIDEDGEFIYRQPITAARVQRERLQAAERREAGLRAELRWVRHLERCGQCGSHGTRPLCPEGWPLRDEMVARALVVNMTAPDCSDREGQR